MRKILVYSGSFNPITHAHIKIALETMGKLKMDKLVIVPVADSYKYKKGMAKAKDRMKMVELTIEELGLDCVEVCDFEISHPEKAYTINTLAYIKTLYPNDDVYYLIGDDNLLFMKEWYKHEDLMKNHKIIVMSRERLVEENKMIIQSDEILNKYMKSFIVVDHENVDVSATMVRTLIRNDQDEEAERYISPQVMRYIKDKKLYKKKTVF